jgi:hypothetical protein
MITHMLVKLRYTNYKGVTKEYTVYPMSLWYGNTEYHPEDQWLMSCRDMKDNKRKDFAVKSIVSWTPA